MAQIEGVQSQLRSNLASGEVPQAAPRGRSEAGVALIALLLLGAAGALVYYTVLTPYLLLLLLVPAGLAAFRFSRWLYAGGIVLTGVTELAVTYLKGATIAPSVLPLALSLPAALVAAEVIQYVTRKQRRTEAELKESETRFRRFVEQSNDGILLADDSGAVVEWNRSLEEISGVKRTDALTRPYWDLAYKMLPEELRNRSAYEKIKLGLKDLFQTGHMPGANALVEREIARPDASRRRVQELIFPIPTKNGYAAGSIFRDVSDRMATELALKETNEKLTISVQELRALNHEAALLNEMGDMLQSCLTVEDAYEVVRQFVARIFPQQSGILFVLEPSDNLFNARAAWGLPSGDGRPFAMDGCWALRRGRTHLVSENGSRLICQHAAAEKDAGNVPPYICVPMTAQGETLGVLHLQAHAGQSFEQLEAQCVPVAVRIALALANLRLRETLRQQSIRDPLTGLFNRRYMEETLERELHRAARHKNPLGVLMLDIDYFKRFNDTFGHDVGDALLEELGAFLRANVRSEDIPCRYGGEEFIIIMPEATLETTSRRAAQLRQGLTGLKIQRRGQSIGPITVSQGVAGFPDHGAGAGQILQAADAALYRAKRGGRDRAVVAEV